MTTLLLLLLLMPLAGAVAAALLGSNRPDAVRSGQPRRHGRRPSRPP